MRYPLIIFFGVTISFLLLFAFWTVSHISFASELPPSPVCTNGATQSCSTSQGCSGSRTCISGQWGACIDTPNDNCPAQVCTPGAKQNCSTSQGCSGTRICNSQGTAWGSCVDNNPNDNCPAQICAPNSTQSCVTFLSCPGIQACNSQGTAWGSCGDVPNDNCPMPKPNLTVVSFIVPGGYSGQTVTASLTVKNTGNAKADPYEAGIHITKQISCTNEQYSSFRSSGLAAGASDSFSINVTLPLSPGLYTAFAMADSDCAISESNNNDNTKKDEYVVLSSPSPPISQQGPFFDFKADVDPQIVTVNEVFSGHLFSDLSLLGSLTPIDVVLVLDTTGSMNDPALPRGKSPRDRGSDPGESTRLTEAKKALKIFLTLLNSSVDRVALVTFNAQDGSIIRASLTDNFLQVANIIDKLKGKGATNMGSGFQESVDAIGSARNDAGKFIVFASDGQENIPPSVLKTMTSLSSDVAVYTIGIGDDITTIDTADCGVMKNADSKYICISGENLLKRVAFEAGSREGEYFFAPDATKLSSLYIDILKKIKDRILQSTQLKITLRPEFEFVASEPQQSFLNASDNETLVLWSLGDLKSSDTVDIKMTLRAKRALPTQPQDINSDFPLSNISYIDSNDGNSKEESVPVMRITVVSGLTVLCSPNVSSAFTGDQVIWQAYAGGGVAPYQFVWHGEGIEGRTENPTAIAYQTFGNKTASISVTDANNVLVTQACDFGVNVSNLLDLAVELIPQPQSGAGPFLPVNLFARITNGYNQQETVNYSFWWDCSDTGTNIHAVSSRCGSLPLPAFGQCATNENGAKCDGIPKSTQTVGHLYPNPSKSASKTFLPKVIVEQGNKHPAGDESSVIVDPIFIPRNLSCSPSFIAIHNTTDSAIFSGSGGDESHYSWHIEGQGEKKCTGEATSDGLNYSVMCFSNGFRTIILEDGLNAPQSCILQVAVPEYEEF